MRVLVAWILAFGLVAVPALAGDGTGTDGNGTTPTPPGTTAAAGAAKSATPDASKPAASGQPEASSMENELQQLRDLIVSQSKELEATRQQLREQKQKMEELQTSLDAVSPSGNGLTASPSVAGIDPTTVRVSNTPAPTSGGLHWTAANPDTDEPAAIHYKGITLTPGGFSAAETVWRSKATSSDINTPFNSVPLPGTSTSNISEFNATGRQSRISMLAEGKLSNVKIGSYYEADFLGAGSASNNNESNSYVLRQRQFWGQAKFDDGFTVTAGQMWSLVTETGHAMDNRTELTPLTIDPEYDVGFVWARQYGFRFTKGLFDDKITLGFSLEGSQATYTVHGNPTGTTTTGQDLVSCPVPGSGGCGAAGTPQAGTILVGGTTTTFTNYLVGQSGTSGGLFNPLANYSYNIAPDLVFKAVWEPGFGHYELFGVVDRFKDRVFPCATASSTTICGTATTPGPNATTAYNYSTTGGGVGASARWHLFDKHADLGFKFMGGNGIGRYGSGGLPDATIRPNGTIALIHNYMALGTLQFYPTPKLDIFMNAGGEYASRTQYINGTGTTPNEGYGAVGLKNSGCWTETPATTTTPVGTTAGAGYVPEALSGCTGDTRNLLEGTLGFWYRFYKGSKGTVQYGMQFSYVVRNTWRGVPAAANPGTSGSPTVDEPMWFTSFRYYLP
jgi:hypothetical protein